MLPSRPSRPPAASVALSVRPGALTVAGGRLLAAAVRLRSARREVDAAAELTVRALPLPLVAAAAIELTRAWGDAVEAEADVIDHLAGSLRSAAWAYDDVEARLARAAR